MNQPIHTVLSEGQQLHRAGDLSSAIRCYEHWLALLPDDVEALYYLGLAHAQRGDITPALHYYKKAIAIDPSCAEAHNNIARIYALQNDYLHALKHYCKAIQVAPDFTEAHYNVGLLLLKHHEIDAAEKQFANVLALQPDHAMAHFYLGVLHLEHDRLDQAEHAFLQVLTHLHEHVDSLVNLGVIALKREQGQRAIDYFTEALVLDEDNLEARNNLAATFMHHDRFENALMYYDALHRQDPTNLEYLYNMGVAQMALGHLQTARAHFETIVTHADNHFAALNNLAAIHMRLGHREEAIALLKRAVLANPNDTASPFMLHALTGDEKNPENCPNYVKNLFNNYALYYEQHMQDRLKYTLPQHIMSALNEQAIEKIKRVLDIGCGTGLSGLVLRAYSEHLTGMDIAGKMLAQAREKKVYDALIESEVIDFLQNDTTQYGLMVAADVLPYLGDLAPLFQTLKLRIDTNGLFIFTCEISPDNAWLLQETIRFSHHPDYIQSVCTQHGFKLLSQRRIVARQQEQHDLDMMLYIAQAN